MPHPCRVFCDRVGILTLKLILILLKTSHGSLTTMSNPLGMLRK